MTTSSRLLALLSLLQARRDWPGAVLARRLEVSPRTVRRDVDRLREMGYSIASTKGRDGGYRLDAGAELPPLLLDDDQAVALAIALQVATTSGADVGDDAARTLATLRRVMPARLRHRLGALDVTAVPPQAQTPVDPVVLVAVGAAVRAREVLRMGYGSDEIRRVEPHHVVARSGRWYLVGWDLDRADWRTYRLDRVVPRTPTGPRFSPRRLPGGVDAATFLASRFRGSTTGTAWPCTGEVVVHAPAAQVGTFAADGTVEDLGDGRCRLVQGAWSWAALAASLGRFDADLEVVGPPELASAFARLGERYARAAGG